jgi:hypothetical protein
MGLRHFLTMIHAYLDFFLDILVISKGWGTWPTIIFGRQNNVALIHTDM